MAVKFNCEYRRDLRQTQSFRNVEPLPEGPLPADARFSFPDGVCSCGSELVTAIGPAPFGPEALPTTDAPLD